MGKKFGDSWNQSSENIRDTLNINFSFVNGNPTPCTDLDKILHTHPHLSKEGFGTGLTPSPLGLGSLKH